MSSMMMSREDRLRFRLRDRLRHRLMSRLRFPAASRPLPGFPRTGAAFGGDRSSDISVSAGESSVSRSLTGDLLAAVRSLPLRCAGRWLSPWAARRDCVSAVRSPLGLLMTWAWTVSLACRVVASRRCSVARTPLVVPADALSARPALAGLSCAAQPSLSRRLVGRWENGRRAARARRAGGGGRR